MKATSNWLEVWARFRPAAEALVDLGTGRRWTYAALHEESLRWSGRLAAEGVGPGDRVGVLAKNRGETLALLFACAERGAMLLPFNWRLAAGELDAQRRLAEPRVVFVDGANAGRIDGPSLEEGPGADPLPGPGSRLGDPWVVMFTSGSTGAAKGALLTHEQLHWNALNTILACDLAPSDSTLTFTPLFHTGGLNCLTTPLLHRGGRVVLATGFEPGEALRVIAAERITLLMGVPTIYQMLADHPAFATTDTASVRDALCGGAALQLPLLERYLARGIPLRQGFGLTEVGPNCFSMPPHEVRRKLGSVGLPIPHVAMKLVRPDGEACGVDEDGELLLSGPAVCGGYWRNPEATAAAMGDGWFRTGDILRRDAEGFYWVRGRKKEMFISGGENVYPAEVEAAIAGCPGVTDVAVVAIPDARWGEVGSAWIEVAPGRRLEPAAVLAHLEPRLARFKVPKRLHVVESLPRTASGKVDKPALLRMEEP